MRSGAPASVAPTHAREKRHAAHERELARRHPVARELEHRDERDPRRGADGEAARIGERHARGQREEQRAHGRGHGAHGEHLARPEAVGEQPRGDLHRHVAVEIERGKVAQRRGRQPEGGGKLLRDHGGRHPLVERDQVQRGGQPPHQPRQRRRAEGFAPPCAPPLSVLFPGKPVDAPAGARVAVVVLVQLALEAVQHVGHVLEPGALQRLARLDASGCRCGR